ncbi:hypothetical protein SMNI109538_19065 [Smaragdicoccus niigatensis]
MDTRGRVSAMTAEENVALYRRWLDEIWTKGNYHVALEILAEDLIDHTPIKGQPTGWTGDIWRQPRSGPPSRT